VLRKLFGNDGTRSPEVLTPKVMRRAGEANEHINRMKNASLLIYHQIVTLYTNIMNAFIMFL